MNTIDVDQFLQSTNHLSSEAHLWRCFLDVIEPAGIPQVAYRIAPQLSNDPMPTRFLSRNDSHPWAVQSVRAPMQRESPFIRAAKKQGRAIRWSDIKQTKLAKPDRDFIRRREETGIMGHGLTIPLVAPFQREGFIFIGVNNRTQEHWAGIDMQLPTIAQIFHQRVCELHAAPVREVRLSARETEVMDAVCSGATNAQIAQSLGISKNTVDTLIRRSYLKLDVNDRVSAALVHFGSR